jgi:3-hydroxyisobutyrate dehydrogenase-like beta-hydroxyacid dehydrogenase
MSRLKSRRRNLRSAPPAVPGTPGVHYNAAPELLLCRPPSALLKDHTAMPRVGFIGLGTMGRPMARNLLRAGHELTIFARRDEVAREFAALGAVRVATPAELTRRSDFVVTIVTADSEVLEVALGPDGIATGAAAGKTLLDMSTVGPWTARRLGEALRTAGMHVLDAPVSGGPWGAEAGTLAIMVGGEPAAFERALPVLRAMGDEKKIFHVGPLGAGQTVKLVNQMIGGAIMTLVGEGLTLARAANVDLEKLADVVAVSSGNSSVFEARARKFVLADNYRPGFTTALMRKDVDLALELGRQLNIPLPVASAALQQYVVAIRQGHSEEDFAAVAKVYADAAGLRLATGSPQSA